MLRKYDSENDAKQSAAPGARPVSGRNITRGSIRSAGVLLLIMLLAGGAFAQSKGGRWSFENNGDDTADWDQLSNSGTLQNQAN